MDLQSDTYLQSDTLPTVLSGPRLKQLIGDALIQEQPAAMVKLSNEPWSSEICHFTRVKNNSMRENPPQFENRIMHLVYVRHVRKSSILLAGAGVRKKIAL